jgi:hypothetical protein
LIEEARYQAPKWTTKSRLMKPCFTIIGAAHMAHGLTQFSAWSKAMLAEEASESLRPFLRMIFVNSKNMLERTRKIFESHE